MEIDRSRTHHLATEVQGTLLVRMTKPNLIDSHNWHVQPNCQRSVRAFRLSGALLDRGPGCYARVSSNLMRRPKLHSSVPKPFLRELSKAIELLALCQPLILASSLSCRGHPNMLSAVAPRRDEPKRKTFKSVRVSIFRAAQNFQTATSIARATRGSRRISPGSCNGLFSEGFPTGVQGYSTDLTRPYEPASHFPFRAGPTATGRLHCSSATFQE